MAATLYLANAYGFSAQQRVTLLPPLVAALEALGAEVWEPFARNGGGDTGAPGWAHAVARRNLGDVVAADGVFAVVNGAPPDEGVAFELGAAAALGKPVFLFRDDFRHCGDAPDFPLNLMLLAGLPADGWRDHLYASLDELARPEKALLRWLAGARGRGPATGR